MEATGNTHQKFRVGDLEIDSGTFTLRRRGEEIALPKLSFELLRTALGDSSNDPRYVAAVRVEVVRRPAR